MMTSMPRDAAPAFVNLWDDRALVLAALGDVSRHRHAAAALLIGLDGNFGIRWQKTWRQTTSAYVPAGVAHELSCGATLMTTLYLFPLSGETQLLSRNFAIDPSGVSIDLPITASIRETMREVHGGGSAQLAARQRLDEALLFGPHSPPPVEPRIAKVAALLHDDDAAGVPLEEIARQVGLSESRLMHLFKEVVGVPTKRYRLWQRMRRLTEHVAAGDSLTMAGLGAGFADSSHLSHGFRSMFGVPASRILNERARLRV